MVTQRSHGVGARRQIINAKRAPYVFISPFFLLFAVFMVWPIFYSLSLSFHKVKGIASSTYVGFQNYGALLSDPRFLHALYNTTYYAAWLCILNVGIGFTLSLLLTSKKLPGRNIFRLSVFLPVLISTVVAGAVFRLILVDTPGGLLNYIVHMFGVPTQKWIDDGRWAMKAVVSLGFWRTLGLSVVYFIGGLQTLPGDLYEAAVIDGATPLQQLRYLTIPLMRPIIAFVSTITLINAYLVFTEVFVLNPSGPARDIMVTLGYYLYESAFRFFKFGYGAAIGSVMTVIIVVLSLVQLKLLGVFNRD